jgi:cystathionine beta-lyase
MRNFDEEIVRIGTGSLKWDALEERYGETGILPMWVADMDFQNAAPIKEALHKLIDDQILGYALPSDTLLESICEWQKERHQMDLEPDNILFSPGVVGAIAMCVQAFSKEGEAVMIHDPVYYPFTNIVQSNERKLVRSSLIQQEGKYVMDFEQIERDIVAHDVKIFILSNPHNPGGRVWTKQELEKLTDICVKHKVILVSDEIHSDLVFKDTICYSPVTFKEEYKNWVVTLHSATKTFNIAGVKCSFFFVFNEELKERIIATQEKTEQASITTFGLVATEAAFSQSKDWLEDVMEYLEGNRQLILDFFDKELPQVEYMIPEATYLFWFDASSCNVPTDELKQSFAKIGEIALNDGSSFGPEGEGWMRLNFASPRSMVEDGLQRIKKTFDELNN